MPRDLRWEEVLTRGTSRGNEVLVGAWRERRRPAHVHATQVFRAHLPVRRALSAVRLGAAEIRAKVGEKEVWRTLSRLVLEGGERVRVHAVVGIVAECTGGGGAEREPVEITDGG